MNKDVLVSINGLQALEDSDDTVEIITVGEYYNKNGKHYILYEDIDEDSGSVTKNIIKVSENDIEIRKKGYVNTTMLFNKKQKNKSYYSTPFGDMLVEIETRDIDVKAQESVIDIKIDYALIINNQHMTDCNISLQVKEKGE